VVVLSSASNGTGSANGSTSTREPRYEFVRARVNSTEKDLSLADAQAMGMTLSEWVRWLILSRLGRHPEAAVAYLDYGKHQGES
jgi:hypothetical protein